ncbi:MAG: hypothetical protein K2P78_12545 [Gemmataceae bacterium]|nr:hypothetical protein [Gemmataceae bacterium]
MKNFLAYGAYAVVFAIEGRVFKLFKKAAAGSAAITDAERLRTFGYEVDAYTIASGEATLRDYIPRFHGAVVVNSVTAADEAGTNISDQFFLDRCYCLDRIEGPEHKMLQQMRYPHVKRMVQEFHACGIRHLEDACIFFPEDPDKMKVIDIAMRNLAGDSTI